MAVLAHGSLMAVDSDVLSWESIRKTRLGIYQALMLSSLKDLKELHPEARTITRMVILSGWGKSFSITQFEKNEKSSSFLIEIKSAVRLSTIYRLEPVDPKDISDAQALLKRAVGSLKWDSPGTPVIGDDDSIMLFERCGNGVASYVTTRHEALPDSCKEAVKDLEKLALQLSREKD